MGRAGPLCRRGQPGSSRLGCQASIWPRASWGIAHSLSVGVTGAGAGQLPESPGQSAGCDAFAWSLASKLGPRGQWRPGFENAANATVNAAEFITIEGGTRSSNIHPR